MPNDKRKKDEQGSSAVSYALGVASDSYALGTQPDEDYSEVNYLRFDGNDVVRGPCDVAAITTASAPFIMKADFKYGSTDNATHQQVVGIGSNHFGGTSAAPTIWVRHDTQKITFYFKTLAGVVDRLNADTAAVVGQRYQVECIYDGDVLSMKIDGVLQTETKTLGKMFIADNNVGTWNVGGSGTASYLMQAGAEIYSASFSGVFTTPLQEGYGLVTHDVSGNGNHGTITGATWSQTVGTSLTFDATDRVLLADPVTPVDSLDISARIKSNTDNTSSNPRYLAALGFRYQDSGIRFIIYQGSLWLSMSNGTVIDTLSTGSVMTNEWMDVRATWDGTTRNIYVDGSVVATDTYTTDVVYNLDDSSIGGYNRGAQYGSECDISNMSVDGYGSWPFSEGSGTVAHDISGNDNDGTIDGATWEDGESIPSWNLTEGFSPKALISNGSFDETQDGEWTAQNGATIYDGYARLNGSSAAVYQDLSITPVVGKTYDIYYEILRSEGSGSLFLSGNGFTASTPVSSVVGPHKESLPCVDVDPLYFIIGNGQTRDVDITNIRCVDPDCYSPALAEPTLSQLTFDGASDYIEGPQAFTDYDETLVITTEVEDWSGGNVGACWTAANGGYQLRWNTGGIRVWVIDSGLTSVYLDYPVVDTTLARHTYEVTLEVSSMFGAGDANITLKVDGQSVAPTGGTFGGDMAPIGTTHTHRVGFSPYGSFTAHNYKVAVEDVTAFEYDFTKYLGRYTEVISDESGNGNDGTISTSSGLSTMWKTRWVNRVVGPDTSVVQYAGGQDNIYTGILANTKTEVVEASIMWNEDAPADQRMGHTAPYFWFGTNSEGKFQMGYGTSISGTSDIVVQAFKRYEVRLEAHGDTGGKLFVDGELACETTTVPPISGSGTFRIFSRSTSNYMNCKLFSFKMWQKGDLVVDATPLAGGVMFDAVTSDVMDSRLDPTTLTTEGLLVEDGTVVDAGAYLPLTNPAGLLQNGAEVSYKGYTLEDLVLLNTDTYSLDRTRLTGDGLVQIFLTRHDTSSDPILEQFLGSGQ